MSIEAEEPTIPTCPECEGAGFVVVEDADGHSHAGHVCDLCGGRKQVSHAALRAWMEARRRRGW